MNAAVYLDLDTWEEMKRTVVLRPLLLEFGIGPLQDVNPGTGSSSCAGPPVLSTRCPGWLEDMGEYSLTQTADRDGSTVVVKVSSDGAATTTITETSPGASR